MSKCPTGCQSCCRAITLTEVTTRSVRQLTAITLQLRALTNTSSRNLILVKGLTGLTCYSTVLALVTTLVTRVQSTTVISEHTPSTLYTVLRTLPHLNVCSHPSYSCLERLLQVPNPKHDPRRAIAAIGSKTLTLTLILF